jgi:hypothetical protein
MRLSKDQIEKIRQRINLSKDKLIVRVDVSENGSLSADDSSSNIYCINNEYEIVWQVKETKTKRPFEDDMFVYLIQNNKGEILADRFSGFGYRIDPDTGEAEQIGFHK